VRRRRKRRRAPDQNECLGETARGRAQNPDHRRPSPVRPDASNGFQPVNAGGAGEALSSFRGEAASRDYKALSRRLARPALRDCRRRQAGRASLLG
jgi:hypothetical protein